MNRLNNLLLVSIEKELLKSIKNENFYNNVIEVFAEKDRRIELLYK